MTEADTVAAERYGRALELAAELHTGQLRKGTTVPYLSHLLAVAALVAEDEGDEDQIIAGLLHDAAEDQGGEATLARIASEFGDKVAHIVRDCSDSIVARGEAKASWQARKSAALARIPSIAGESVVVIAADKLHNIRSTATDFRIVGPVVWDRFKTGRDGFLWYHDEMFKLLNVAIPNSRSVQEMDTLLRHLGAHCR